MKLCLKNQRYDLSPKILAAHATRSITQHPSTRTPQPNTWRDNYSKGSAGIQAGSAAAVCVARAGKVTQPACAAAVSRRDHQAAAGGTSDGRRGGFSVLCRSFAPPSGSHLQALCEAPPIWVCV